MTQPARSTGPVRLVRWIVHAYPRHVRGRFEAGMHDALAREYEHARARGWRAAAAFAWLSFADALRSRFPKGSVMRSLSSTLALDWRYAVRSLRSTPVVTLVAVLSLGLGIGANTALFSIVNGLILKALPVRDPASLVMLQGDQWTNPIWEEIRARDRDLFDGALAWSDDRFDLAPGGATDFVPGVFASGSFFDVLGVPPLMGRTITPADDVRGPASAVAMVSHRFWQQRLGGRSDAIGRVVTLNRVPFTIVGVMPPAFFGPVVGRHIDVVIPIGARTVLAADDRWLTARERWWLEIMVRAKPGQSADQATAALRGIQPQIREATAPERRPQDPDRHLTTPLTLVAAASGESALRDRYQRPLTTVMVVVAAVLLIACANIASLLLARAAARRQEFTIRVALGASTWRIRRQLLAESLILAVLGAALGLLLAPLGSALLVSQIGASAALDVAIDWRVLVFTTVVAGTTAVFFGLAPASTLSRLRANDALVSAGRGVGGDRAFGLRQAIVVVQVALSLVLIVAAGLFLRTFSSLARAPLGFDPAPLVLAGIDLPRDDARTSDPGLRFDAMRPLVGEGGTRGSRLPGNPPCRAGKAWRGSMRYRRAGSTRTACAQWRGGISFRRIGAAASASPW
jgi:putative ABC transport system permease protein